MPLPKPPAKRASVLSASDFDTQAPLKPHRRAPKSRTSSEPAASSALDLLEPVPSSTPTVQARRPALPPAPATPVARAVEALDHGATPVSAPSAALASFPPTQHPAPLGRARKPRGTGPAKLFVVDTNVLLHDPMSLFRFEEHDLYLPMITLEELDSHKRGMSEVARSARQVSRELDAVVASLAARESNDMSEGIPLSSTD